MPLKSSGQSGSAGTLALIAGTGQLPVAVAAEAKKMGYHKMRLDTFPVMKQAIALYYSLGFKPISPYRENPIDGALFLELALQHNQ